MEANPLTQPIEDFLIELEHRGDQSVLDLLPGYLSAHYAQWLPTQYGIARNIAIERSRLVIAFEDKVPHTKLSGKMLEIIKKSN